MWVLDRGRIAPHGMNSLGSLWQLILTSFMCLLAVVNTVTGSTTIGSMKTSYACQRSELSLNCPSGYVIKVMRANYGRFSLDICNDAGISDWSVECMAPRSLRILQDRCNLKGECDITADSKIFGGDPCPDVPKYLEVYFGCFLETSTTTSTTPNPLPPWLTTRSPISFLPGLLDLDITLPVNDRVPFTAPQEEENSKLTTTVEPKSSTIKFVTTTISSGRKGIDSMVVNMTEKPQIMKTKTTTPSHLSDLSGPQLKDKISTAAPMFERNTSSPLGDDENEKQDRLVYTSDRSSNDSGVLIVLSTLPPPKTVYPSVSPHSEGVSSLTMCPPRNIRALSWGWTRQGSESVQACPQGTTGKAHWVCTNTWQNKRDSPQWATSSPDLSDCQSVWMEKIIKELRKSDMILNLANDLMQYVSVNALYGGDIKSAIDAMTIIAEKMLYQLKSIPTMEQREAMVMELVQSVTKTASSLLSDHNIPAWQDLPTTQQNRFLSNFIRALEKTGSLLPAAVANDQEVSISSDNLLLTVRKISFRNIRSTQFPSLASLATPYWKDYSDSIEIPALVLMENMNMEGSEVVFLSLRNLDKLLVPSKINSRGIHEDISSSTRSQEQIVNSQVIHLSFGDSLTKTIVNEPLSMVFRHKDTGNVTSPQCVMWGKETWSPEHCNLVSTNQTHSVCECSRVGTFALLEKLERVDMVGKMTFLVMIIISITISVITFISVLLAFLYCHRIKVHNHLKLGLTKNDLSCFKSKERCWSLNDTPTSLNEDLFPTSHREERADSFDIVQNSDFMILSRAALEAHDTVGGEHTVQTGCIPGPQVHSVGRQGGRTLAGMKSGMPGVQFTNLSTCRLQSPAGVFQQQQPASHIYMEVDPLYCGRVYSGEQGICGGQETGLVSSSSSQTSSGYSTAPSDHLHPSHSFYETAELGDVSYDYDGQYQCPGLPVYQQQQFASQSPEQEFVTKERVLSVYSISQSCNRPPQSSERIQQRRNVGAPDFGTAHPLLMQQRGGVDRI